jgi:hypothetical protein
MESGVGTWRGLWPEADLYNARFVQIIGAVVLFGA